MKNKRKPLPLCWLEVRWKENPALIGVKTFDSFNEAVEFGLSVQEEYGPVEIFACFGDGSECKLRGVVENAGFAE